MKEADLARPCAIEANRLGHRVFIQPTGGGWTGKPTKLAGGWVKMYQPKFVRYGLCVGSCDLIGWTSSGKFLAIEIKTKTGRIRPDQKTFIEVVNNSGGIAFVARSVADVTERLDGI